MLLSFGESTELMDSSLVIPLFILFLKCSECHRGKLNFYFEFTSKFKHAELCMS